MELAPFGIKVVVLAPGIIKTNLFATAAEHTQLRDESQYKALESSVDTLGRMAESTYLPVDVFARKTLAYLEKQGALGGTSKLLPAAPYYSIGGSAWLLLLLARLPRWLSDFLLRDTYKIPSSLKALVKLEKRR